MKNSILKWYMFAVVFLGSLVTFAQPSDDEGTGPCLECEDTPIDSKLMYLAIAAIALAYVYFRSNVRKKVNA